MFIYFISFFLLLLFFFTIGKASLNFGKKINISSDILSLNLVTGIFVVGSFSFIFNFFSGTSNIFFYLSLLILFCFSLISLIIEKNDKKKIYKNLFILFVFSFVFFLYSLQLPPGYDAGLYHIPYQGLIKEEKIIFGLSNINSRFGLSSFYNYVATIFWVENDFTIVAFFNSIYLIIFFLFLKELINKNFLLLNIIVIGTLLGMPIWFRYNVPGFSLVDFPYSVFFYLSLILPFLIFLDKDNNKTYFHYFILSCAMAFMHKANGAILFPLLIVIIAYHYFKKKIDINLLFLLLFIPSLVVILWLLRGFIVSSCLIYPLDFTCIDTIWYNRFNTENEYLAIKLWAKQGFNLIDWLDFSLKNVSLFLFVPVILFFFKNKIVNVILKNKIIFIISSLSVLFYIYLIADPLQGFSSLYSSNNESGLIKILKKEFLLILTSNFFIIFFTLLISNSFNNLSLKLDKNTYCKIPFVFLIFYFISWLFTAPNPRFAIAAFALISPLCCIFFIKEANIISNKNLTNVCKFIFFISLIKVSLFDLFFLKNLNLDIKKIPEPEIINRKTFGVIPKNVKIDNRCWAIKECYYYEQDIIVKKYFLNYKIYQSSNEKN